MPESLEHYRALLTALGRLVGSHRCGHIAVGDHFPVDMQAAQVGVAGTDQPAEADPST